MQTVSLPSAEVSFTNLVAKTVLWCREVGCVCFLYRVVSCSLLEMEWFLGRSSWRVNTTCVSNGTMAAAPPNEAAVSGCIVCVCVKRTDRTWLMIQCAAAGASRG